MHYFIICLFLVQKDILMSSIMNFNTLIFYIYYTFICVLFIHIGIAYLYLVTVVS